MKLTPYSKLLKMTKEAIDTALVPVRSKAMRKKAELEHAKLEEQVATLEQKINEACSQKELNFDSLIDKMDELDLTKRKLLQFEKILKELFPEE